MLIDHISNYCNNSYHRSEYVCENCQHPDKCSGSCKKCLAQVHYPNKNTNGKKDYDCTNLINFYMCDYSFKYASEMLYLLRKSTALRDIDDYHILSIGCGGCPDLMAFEAYVKELSLPKKIQYYGIDKNPLWKTIHNEIAAYTQESDLYMKVRYLYDDAIEHFNSRVIKDANVIVIQYLISHLYNTEQIDEINDFYKKLISNIILHKKSNEPLVILINDVNSCYRGRNYFINLCDELINNDLHGSYSTYYFDYNIKHDSQRYGTPHDSNNVLFDIPEEFDYYEPWKQCSSAQMLIEVD